LDRPVLEGKYLDVVFSSKLPALTRPQLESVFFFNPGQALWHREIRKVVDEYGVPEIREVDEQLSLVLRGEDRIQTLFAFNSKQPNLLKGVIIYGRFQYAEILVLHLALARLNPTGGLEAREGNGCVDFLGLLTAFSKVMKGVVGIERMRFAYWDLSIPLI